jgi:hypothetical protein
VIIHDLNLVGVSFAPNETQTPLIVDPHTVLPFSITVQRFEPISGWRCHIPQFRGAIQLPKLSSRDMLDRPKAAAWLPMVKSPGFRTTERLDHRL